MEDIEIPVPVLREFCAENLTHVAAALEAGAERIELCDNLAVGGDDPVGGRHLESMRGGARRGRARDVHGAAPRRRFLLRPG